MAETLGESRNPVDTVQRQLETELDNGELWAGDLGVTVSTGSKFERGLTALDLRSYNFPSMGMHRNDRRTPIHIANLVTTTA